MDSGFFAQCEERKFVYFCEIATLVEAGFPMTENRYKTVNG